MEEWFRAASAIEVPPIPNIGPALSTHAFGGTRMGDAAATNVVARCGFSHEAQNLGVPGG